MRFNIVQKNLNKSRQKPTIPRKLAFYPIKQSPQGKPNERHCGTGNKQKVRHRYAPASRRRQAIIFRDQASTARWMRPDGLLRKRRAKVSNSSDKSVR